MRITLKVCRGRGKYAVLDMSLEELILGFVFCGDDRLGKASAARMRMKKGKLRLYVDDKELPLMTTK